MIELQDRFGIATEFQAIADHLLDAAKVAGATAAEVDIDKGTGLSVEVRMGTVDKLQYHRDQSVNLTVYFGHRKGFASTGDFSKQALNDTLDAACRIASYTSEDPFNGLADRELMATEFPKLDLYHPWELDAEQAIEMATHAEAVAREHDKRITNSEGASVDSYAGISLYANSHEFMAVRHSTRHSISCAVVAQEGSSMQRDHWYSVSRVPSLLDSADTVGAEAAQRAVRRLHARSLSTREAPVLFVPQLARGLIGSLVSAISGSAQYHKASFLLDSLGQAVFPEFFHLLEDPFLRQGFGSRSYDAEGVATQKRDIVNEGIIQGYFLGSYSARKLGMQSTGSASGATNLILSDTGVSFIDLIQQMGTGLMVTELIGSGINGITGDYSRGAVGYWIENGMIMHPVEEVTIAGNLKSMFKGIVGVANDVDTRGSIHTGSILIDKMTIAGQ
jgi:PmbA protein